MSTDTSPDYERLAGDPTGIARCAPLEGQKAPYTVHGVAIGAGDVTLGENSAKFWPAEALRRAAATLVGVPLTKNHDDERVEAVIGEVVDAGFDPDVGVVYEAEVDDRGLATKIARGRLEVSIHAVHADGGRTDDGYMIAEQIRFLDLSVVPRGAAQSNTIESGTSQSEALASLSTDEVATMLAQSADSTTPESGDAPTGQSDRDADAHEDSIMTDDTTETPEQAPDADSELDEATEAELDDGTAVEAEADAEANEADADAEESDAELASEPDAEAVEDANASADDISDADDEAELREEIAELRAANEELRHELEGVRMEYAERLADGGPFEAAELAEQFDFDTLQAKFESQAASLAESTQAATTPSDVPAPKTGDASDDATLSTSPDEHADEIATLEAKVEQYDELGWDNAKAEAESELETLRE
jgi:hypothetical protein